MPIRSRSILPRLVAAVLLASLAVACGDNLVGARDDAADSPDATVSPDAAVTPDAAVSPDAAPATIPTVLSTTPANAATGVPRNTNITARFSEPMDAATLTAATFTVTAGTPAIALPGNLVFAGSSVTFWPVANLAANTAVTATVTTGAKSALGVALAANHAWTFTTGDVLTPGLGVNLGTAASFAILAKSAVSTVPPSAVTGDVGVSPAAATFITGFTLTLDATTTFATSPQVTGKIYAADYAPPTPVKMTTAIGDMQIAFTDAGARAPGVTELGAGNIGGRTLSAGVYKWGTGLLIPSNVTLDGSATDVWIFQIAQDLTVSPGAMIVLTGGALAKNVFWQVAGQALVDTTGHLEGTILGKTTVTLRTGASVNGRLLAQTAVIIDHSVVVAPL